MDRQTHDYASAMAFSQQQQQQGFGFQPHPQQFPQHGPPFIAPHPSHQQYPYSRHLPPQQMHPHHLLHLQQQTPLGGGYPPHIVPPHQPFHQSFDAIPPPMPVPPPADIELQKRIDLLVEYAAKNGPEFETMLRDKQRDNPAYAFLFGGEGHGYYRYKLWVVARPPDIPFGSMMPPQMNPMLNPSNMSPARLSSGGASPSLMMGAAQLHPGYAPSYEQHQMPSHSQSYLGQPRGEYGAPTNSFKGLSGPLPPDVASELNGVVNSLTGTKESIKGAKMWFMQRSPFAPALAEALKERVFMTEDSEKQLHIVFLANDILFDSLQRRINPADLDNEALAFKPVLGQMLARIYHNPHNKDANQSRLSKILQFWGSKEVYNQEIIHELESEMMSGSEISRMTDSTVPHSLGQWQHDKYNNSIQGSLNQDLHEKSLTSMPVSQFVSPVSTLPTAAYPPVNSALFPSGSLQQIQPSLAVQPPSSHMLPSSTAVVGEKPRPPPYPLFPPGLIPGMVRKMQIGSGVPYSPLSPLDIPTAIPPSTVSQSEILERVSKFFKEIGEVNPSEGPMDQSDASHDHVDYERDEYEHDSIIRKTGACIPPPANLQADPETGTYPDGSVDRKHGSSSGRLGVGATADPNEVSQYDDVYSSYRKQRSTNYHTTMSSRSVTR